MIVTLGEKKLHFIEKMNFDTHLKLLDIRQKHADGVISYRDLIYDVIRTLLIKIDEQTDIKKNLEYIKNIDDVEHIETLANSIGEYMMSLDQKQEKKSKK